MKFVSIHGARLVSKTGMHIVDFPRGVAKEIPRFLEQDAYACGCVPADMVILNAVNPTADPAETNPVEPVDHTPELHDAFTQLLATIKKADFAPSGRPRIGPVRKLVTFDVTPEDIDAAWESFEVS